MNDTSCDITRELDLARTTFGPLNADARARLQAVVDHPTTATWENAKGLVLIARGRRMTLWQFVRLVDPTFPNEGRVVTPGGRVLREWARVPDRALLVAALQAATH